MVDAANIIAIIQYIVLVLLICSSLLYSILSVFIRPIRNRLHAFPINVCAAILCCSIYWIVCTFMSDNNARQFYNTKTCSLIFYMQTMCTVQVPLALTIASIHRLCCVVYYNKMFFKSMRWISMCIISQWLIGIILSLPIFIRNSRRCSLAPWMAYYTLVIIIILPLLICTISDFTIYKHVKSSTQRIQPVSQATVGIPNNDQQTKLSHRDIHLLRHMIIMFLVFVLGWAPIYITSVVMTTYSVSTIVLRCLSLLAELSLLCDIIDLFLYSHDLRQVLGRTLLQCCH